MNLFRRALDTFRIIKEAVSLFRLWRYYGPDVAARYSRDLSQEDVSRHAAREWSEEAFFLLPRRYANILKELADGEFISEEVRVACEASSYTVVMSGGEIWETRENGQTIMVETLPAPWKEDPQIIQRVPEFLQAKIQSFEEDCLKLNKSEDGFYMSLGI